MLRRVWLLILTALFIGSSFAGFHIKDHANNSIEERKGRWQQAAPDISKLRTGDLIFRHSRGFISEALMSFNQKEKKYSHAGIIKIEDGTVYVYHSIAGEENKSNKLRKELLDSFCDPGNVFSFSIYRSQLSDEQRKAVASLADFYFKSGLQFDTDFSLASDDKMYCTEFVYKTFSKVLARNDYFTTSNFSDINYIACDDLYLNSRCSIIYSYQY